MINHHVRAIQFDFLHNCKIQFPQNKQEAIAQSACVEFIRENTANSARSQVRRVEQTSSFTCVYALCVLVLHVLKRTLCLCYMYLHTPCACVPYVHTYQSATPQQDTTGTTDGGSRIFGSKQQGRFFLHLDTRVLQLESLPEQWLLLPFVELVSLKTIEICNSTATSGLITSREPARRMFFVILLNNNDRTWV